MTGPILVAGAGPAGATAARSLASRGHRVVIVDPVGRRVDRVELLPRGAAKAIKDAGIMDLLRDRGLAMPYSDAAGGGVRASGWHPVPGDGWILNRLDFDDRIRERAQEAGAEVIRARVVGCSAHEDGVIVQLDPGTGGATLIHATAVIDATGRPAALARRLGGRRVIHHRQAAGLTAREALPTDCRFAARWSEARWAWCGRGPGGEAECWTIPPDPLSKRRVDASPGMTMPAAGPRWIAVGDAAVAFDPVNGQGLSHALQTGLLGAGAMMSGLPISSCDSSRFDAAVKLTYSLADTRRDQARFARQSAE